MRKTISLSALISSLLASPVLAGGTARPQDVAGGDQPICIPSVIEPGQDVMLPAEIETHVRAFMRGEPLNAEGMQDLHRRMTIRAQGAIERALRDRPEFVAAPAAGGAGVARIEPARGVDRAVRLEKAAFLGISTMTVDATLGEQLSLPRGMGLVVEYVEKGSPAEEAGVKPHDVARKLDDQLLVNPQQLAVLVRAKKAGESVALTVIRGGKEVVLSAKLTEKDLPPLQTLLLPNTGWGGGGPFGGMRDGPGEMGQWNLRIDPLDLHGTNVTMHAENGGKSIVRTLVDGQHDIRMTTEGDKSTLVVKDREGKVIYEGDPAEAKLPADIQSKVDGLQKNLAQIRLHQLEGKLGGGVQRLEAKSVKMDLNRSDDQHVIALHVDEKGKSVNIKDAKSNAVVFDGPINTDEEFSKLPEDLQKKVKALMEKTLLEQRAIIIKNGVEDQAR